MPLSHRKTALAAADDVIGPIEAAANRRLRKVHPSPFLLRSIIS